MSISTPIAPQSSARVRRGPPPRVAVAWTPPEQMDHRDWVTAGQRLGEMGRISNWWIGDWLRYGNTRWGEKYVEASKITGIDGKTLRNIAYVASRFDLSRRRDNLSWTHHAEVAALDPGEQDTWLDCAVGLRLSATDLRLEVRSSQRVGKDDVVAGRNEALPSKLDHTMICPHCGNSILLPRTPRVSSTAGAPCR
jgi:hypothetical protein